jgi:SAM-dependent methyltransferase
MEKGSDGKDYGKNWDPYSYYKNTEVAGQYDSSRFSSLSGRVFDRLEKAALRAAVRDLPPESLVLDAPSGTGRLAETLLEMGHRVVGVDISREMLTVAQRKLERFGQRYKAVVSDARDLGFEPESFDAVLCARVLMHFPLDEQIDFLGAISKFSKGLVVYNQGVLTNYHRARRWLKRLLRNQSPASFPLQVAEVDQLMRGAGLIQSRRHSVMPFVSEAVFFVCKKRSQ